MALSIPELQFKESLAEYFRLPLTTIANALEFLLEAGLAEIKAGRYVIGRSHVHLGNDANLINSHHVNWRLQAMDSLYRPRSNDLHYSVVFSLSVADAEKLKERFIQMIKDNQTDIGPSKEEVLYVTCADFFEVRKS